MVFVRIMDCQPSLMDTSRKPILPNPQVGAWPLGRLFFTWLVPLLWTGSRKGLTADNLTECLPADRSDKLGDKLEAEWLREVRQSKKKNRQPHLKYALMRTFKRSFLPEGLLFLAATFLKTFLPVILARLLVLFQHHPNPTNPTVARNGNETLDTFQTLVNNESWDFFEWAFNNKNMVGGFLGVASLVFAMTFHHAEMKQRMLGAKFRIALCSMIYRKTLRMSKLASSQTSAGYLINLLSNDVNRMDLGLLYMHYIWVLPLQSLLVIYLIYVQIGWPAFVGVVGLLVQTMPVQTLLSRMLSALRLKVALKTDERVGFMHEIVQGIQVIKMYAWEPFFRMTVDDARDRELRQVRTATYIRGFNLCMSIFVERSTLCITIVTCALVGLSTTADMVFSMAQFYNVLMLTAAIFYPLALAFGGEALVSIKRVEEFLLLEEQTSEIQIQLDPSSEGKNDKLSAIMDAIPVKHSIQKRENVLEFTNVSAAWDPATKQTTLEEVTFGVRTGSLCAVIGAVGAGKSSLLHLLLGELPITDGRFVLADGATLSYASQEPWLFAGTVRHNILFGQKYDHQRYQQVVQCCSLNRDFELLSHGDKTIVGDRGSSLSGGQRARIGLARAVYKQSSVYLLDDPLSAVDSHVGRHLFDEVIGHNGFLAKTKATRILVTHQVHLLQQADHIVILDKGRVVMQGSYTELANSDVDFSSMLQKFSEDNETPDETDDDLPHELLVRQESLSDRRRRSRTFSISSMASSNSRVTSISRVDDSDPNAEELTGKDGSAKVWGQYLSAGSGALQLTMLAAMMLFSQMVIARADFYLIYWTDRETERLTGDLDHETQAVDLYVYAGILILLILLIFIRSIMFFNLAIRTSKALHSTMLGNLLAAPMRFFDTNPAGRILNRFSKDLGAVDETLPCAMIEAIHVMLLIVGILCIVSILNPIMLAVLAGALVFFVGLLYLYLRTAQDLKRLEGITRSPVFSYLSATMNGISTIRSCGLESKLVSEFDGLQDVHSAVWRLSMAANTGLGVWLDCLSISFVMFVTFSFIHFFDDVSSGNVGMALSQSMILTNYVQYGVRQTTLALQQLTNVERVLQYNDLDKEPDTDVEPSKDWPSNGNIRFEKMSLRYSKDDAPTLKDLNIEIQSGWKVGIVGRTGAGKSSLISALFRLATIDGTISIDNIDTASISLKFLRSRVSIIPQEPVLFSATIRRNLDPFEQYSDDQLWHALTAVELKNDVPMLDYMVTEAGSNFSIGQRQLVCLARAILRKDRVLVLDEATANVDPQTDALIQRTIRERFVDSTVLTIAHRLRTVMDSDRILVMDAGRVCEFDAPHNLLQDEAGVFSQMVVATGKEAETLRKIAAETFEINSRKSSVILNKTS